MKEEKGKEQNIEVEEDNQDLYEKVSESKEKKKLGIGIYIVIGLIIFSLISVSVILIKSAIFKEEIKVNSENLDENGKLIITTDEEYIDSDYEDTSGLTDSGLGKEEYEKLRSEEEIEKRNLGLPATKEDLLSSIYDYSSKGKYVKALKQLEYYLENNPDEKENLYYLLEDLNNLTLAFEDINSVEDEYLISYTRDQELYLYSFLDSSLDYQIENVKIKDSVVIPEHSKVYLREQIQPIDLPYFEDYFDSRSIKGKEIWKLTTPVNEYTPDANFYIIYDSELETNQIFYTEYSEDFPNEYTTRYIHLN
ncbi:hypothetical protein [Brassicibacter mesophilus]|uniref:hypothetical protein n=1 Tax=Brassicibacter mesophilus TaxID=745119 RepID=UPI003D1B2556